MANLFARASANWASASWNTAADGSGSSATPGASDVCMANGFTVTINENVTVAECRCDSTGGAANTSQFVISPGVTLTANLYNGGTPTSGIGSFTTPTLTAGQTITVVGNVYATTGTQRCLYAPGVGTLNVTGDAYGGTTNNAFAVQVGGGLSLTGNAYGGSASSGSAPGVYSTGTLSCTIIGNCIAHATSSQPGLMVVAGSGTCVVTGYVQSNDYGPGSSGISAGYGVTNAGQSVVEIGEARSGARGLPAVSGAFRFASATAAKTTVRATSGLTSVALRPVAAVVPAQSDVRSGTTYGDGGYTGTLVVTSGGARRANMSTTMG